MVGRIRTGRASLVKKKHKPPLQSNDRSGYEGEIQWLSHSQLGTEKNKVNVNFWMGPKLMARLQDWQGVNRVFARAQALRILIDYALGQPATGNTGPTRDAKEDPDDDAIAKMYPASANE